MGSPVILLAEDQQTEALLVQRALGAVDLARFLRIVSDGEQAIAYLEGTGEFSNRLGFPLPNLFLLDLKMPRKDGFEVLEWVRARHEFNSLPVVVLSTSNNVYDIKNAYDRGASAYYVKPVAFNKFVELMKEIQASAYSLAASSKAVPVGLRASI